MKVSAVGSTNALLFEPENKKEEKKLKTYVENKEFLETKTGKTNLKVSVGTLIASYLALAVSAVAKKPKAKITSTILAFAGLATSIGFCIKNAVDFKKFKEPKPEPQPEQVVEPQVQEAQPNLAMQA